MLKIFLFKKLYWCFEHFILSFEKNLSKCGEIKLFSTLCDTGLIMKYFFVLFSILPITLFRFGSVLFYSLSDFESFSSLSDSSLLPLLELLLSKVATAFLAE